MSTTGNEKNGWQMFLNKAQLVWNWIMRFFAAAGRAVHVVVDYIGRMHKVFLGVPVIIAAIWLAKENAQRLPEMVGLGIQETGEYLQVVSRNAAVLGPFAVTAVCLVLMFLSRRAVYPWLISVFSLILPIVIWLTNIFPA